MLVCYCRYMSLKGLVWVGASKKEFLDFPDGIKDDMGYQLYRLQNGEEPLTARRMQSLGTGIWELKEQDAAGWYRVAYVLIEKSSVHVLHAFKKKTRKTEKLDLALITARFKSAQASLRKKDV